MSQESFEINIYIITDKLLLHLPDETHELPEQSIDFLITCDIPLNDYDDLETNQKVIQNLELNNTIHSEFGESIIANINIEQASFHQDPEGLITNNSEINLINKINNLLSSFDKDVNNEAELINLIQSLLKFKHETEEMNLK